MTRTVIALAVGISLFPAGARCQSQGQTQNEQRVTIETLNGETVQGILRGLTPSEAVIEVAGQSLHFDLETVRYISFVGRIQAGDGTVALSPLEKAIQALGKIGEATQTGVLREQYSALLVENVPPIREFATSTSSEWVDVRLLMALAIKAYKTPLDSIDNWQYGSGYLSEGAMWASYAMKLAEQAGERTHLEDQTERLIEFSDADTNGMPKRFTGRLGFGDRTIPANLDRASAGAFNDVYLLRLSAESTVNLTMSLVPTSCLMHLLLADKAGQLLDSASKRSSEAKIKKKLEPGDYKVWAGCEGPAQVGNYQLVVSATKR